MNARQRWETRCREAGVALVLGPMLAVLEAPIGMWAVVGYGLVLWATLDVAREISCER